MRDDVRGSLRVDEAVAALAEADAVGFGLYVWYGSRRGADFCGNRTVHTEIAGHH